MSNQEEREKYLVEEYLLFKSIHYRNLRVLSEFRPDWRKAGITGPDIKVLCTAEDKEEVVGIEVTEYQSDREGKESPARRAEGVWKAIYRTMKDVHFPSNPMLTCLHLTMAFSGHNPPPVSEASSIAHELTRFLLSKLENIGKVESFRNFKGYKKPGDFDAYPLLKARISRIGVNRVKAGPREATSWHLSQMATVGVVEDSIVKIINNKATKLGKYDLSDVDECWLLICAGVQVSADGAGPGLSDQRRQLQKPEISGAAEQSGFDRVIFWERRRGWEVVIHRT